MWPGHHGEAAQGRLPSRARVGGAVQGVVFLQPVAPPVFQKKA